jgi:hypothetical protein
MKKFTGLAVMTVTMLIMSANADAGVFWKVDIRNLTNYTYDIEVSGEHLFWRQVDCRVTAGPMTQGISTCVMPEAICPTGVEVSPHGANDVKAIREPGPSLTSCFNTVITIYEKDGKPQFRWTPDWGK